MSTGVRYPSGMAARARRLRTAGWSLRDIARILERENGPRPAATTILRWVDPAWDETHRRTLRRRRLKAAREKDGRLGRDVHSPDFQAARARSLRKLGLSWSHVADVMAFDYPAGGWTGGGDVALKRVRVIRDGARVYERRGAAT